MRLTEHNDKVKLSRTSLSAKFQARPRILPKQSKASCNDSSTLPYLTPQYHYARAPVSQIPAPGPRQSLLGCLVLILRNDSSAFLASTHAYYSLVESHTTDIGSHRTNAYRKTQRMLTSHAHVLSWPPEEDT